MGLTGTVIIITSAVLIGTILQRLSGTGVGLVVAPVLSLLLGASSGVLVTNMTTVVSGFLIMLTVWRVINWRAYWLIIPAAIVGAWPGAWLVGQLPNGWLSILLGSLVVIALVLTVTLRSIPEWKSPFGAVLAGLFGGFFNTTSGVAAPVMVVYSRISRWNQTGFSATLQPVFVTMGLASVISKLTLGSADLGASIPMPFGWLFAAIIGSVGLGLVIATVLVRHISSDFARNLAMVLAGLGGISAIVRGLIDVIV